MSPFQEAASLTPSVHASLKLSPLCSKPRILPVARPVEKAWSFIHIALYVVFTLFIVGVSAPSQDCNKAAAILVAILFAIQAAICVVFFMTFRSRSYNKGYRDKEGGLIVVALLSIPFLAVRVAYGLADMFTSDGSAFASNVVAMALLQYVMEFVVAALFLYAGFVLLPGMGPERDSGLETRTGSPFLAPGSSR